MYLLPPSFTGAKTIEVVRFGLSIVFFSVGAGALGWDTKELGGATLDAMAACLGMLHFFSMVHTSGILFRLLQSRRRQQVRQPGRFPISRLRHSCCPFLFNNLQVPRS